MQLETRLPRNPSLLRGCEWKVLFNRDCDLAVTMIDKASVLCVLRDVHYRGWSYWATERKVCNSDPSPSSTAIHRFALFRSKMVIKEVSSVELRCITFALSHSCLLRNLGKGCTETLFQREKEHSGVVVNRHAAKPLLPNVYLLLIWAKRVEFSRISFFVGVLGGKRKA